MNSKKKKIDKNIDYRHPLWIIFAIPIMCVMFVWAYVIIGLVSAIFTSILFFRFVTRRNEADIMRWQNEFIEKHLFNPKESIKKAEDKYNEYAS